MQDGFDVLGCYMSPVNDAYWKQMLAPGRHRVRMCQLAAADSGARRWARWARWARAASRGRPELQGVALGSRACAGREGGRRRPRACAACPLLPA